MCQERTFDEHLQTVKTVLKCLKEFGIKLNAEMCFFFKSGVKYMVNIFNLKGYGDGPLNIAAT